MDNAEAIRRIKDHIIVHHIGEYPHIKIGEALNIAMSALATDNNVGHWIPVSERLPDKDGSYLVTTTKGTVTTARFYVGKTYPPTRYRPTEYTSPTKWQSNRHVTHWMPLPESPQEN